MTKTTPDIDRVAVADRADPAVEAFLSTLDHPEKPVLLALRQILLDTSPEISEGIKWNSPSFRTTEWFATTNLRGGRVWLILHLGARVKPTAQTGVDIADPTGLLEWLGKDRAVVKFAGASDLATRAPALQALIREWIRLLR